MQININAACETRWQIWQWKLTQKGATNMLMLVCFYQTCFQSTSIIFWKDVLIEKGTSLVGQMGMNGGDIDEASREFLHHFVCKKNA